MKRTRRWGSAVAAGLVAGGLLLGASRLEAAPKKGGEDGQAAKCEYLASIIAYPYVNPAIKVWAISLYNQMGCQPAL
jgi:hypothetical protein